jgi:transposase
LAAKGRSQTTIAESIGLSQSCVSRVLKRFRKQGFAGLFDRREDNGTTKLDEVFLARLKQLLDGSPRDYGYARPTWTRELLVRVMEENTGVRIHVGTMSHALRRIGARRGRPKPIVLCPWKKRKRQRRLRLLRKLRETLPANEMLFYEDEVDIHLNPKIGMDWMNRGHQKRVLTPGQNEKCYLAGAKHAGTGKITWVGGTHKNSGLFVQLLQELIRGHPGAKVLHLILDNFKIHKSQQTEAAVAQFNGRIQLHFLPPYCPDENSIERDWKDLHDNVTRNHRCSTLIELCEEVVHYLNHRNHRRHQPLRRIAA